MIRIKKILTMAMLSIVACSTVKAGQQENKSQGQISAVPNLKLNNGIEMPQLGLGLFRIPEGDATYNAVTTALKAGYRHFDCAHAYQNERSLGKAVKESGIPREEIWLTSKLWVNEYGEGKTLAAIDKMLKRLGVNYIDLVYLHQSIGDYIGAWKDLERAIKQGKVRAIGISNFDVNDEIFDSLVETANIKPAVMQIESHPYAQRTYWQEKVKKYDIKIECWFPLGGRDSNGEILRDPVIVSIAKSQNKTAAQVVLRWHIQEGFSVIPGTDNPDYIKENINVFDFKLSDADMQRIRALNKEKRYFTMSREEQEQRFGNYVIED